MSEVISDIPETAGGLISEGAGGCVLAIAILGFYAVIGYGVYRFVIAISMGK